MNSRMIADAASAPEAGQMQIARIGGSPITSSMDKMTDQIRALASEIRKSNAITSFSLQWVMRLGTANAQSRIGGSPPTGATMLPAIAGTRAITTIPPAGAMVAMPGAMPLMSVSPNASYDAQRWQQIRVEGRIRDNRDISDGEIVPEGRKKKRRNIADYALLKYYQTQRGLRDRIFHNEKVQEAYLNTQAYVGAGFRGLTGIQGHESADAIQSYKRILGPLLGIAGGASNMLIKGGLKLTSMGLNAMGNTKQKPTQMRIREIKSQDPVAAPTIQAIQQSNIAQISTGVQVERLADMTEKNIRLQEKSMVKLLTYTKETADATDELRKDENRRSAMDMVIKGAQIIASLASNPAILIGSLGAAFATELAKGIEPTFKLISDSMQGVTDGVSAMLGDESAKARMKQRRIAGELASLQSSLGLSQEEASLGARVIADENIPGYDSTLGAANPSYKSTYVRDIRQRINDRYPDWRKNMGLKPVESSIVIDKNGNVQGNIPLENAPGFSSGQSVQQQGGNTTIVNSSAPQKAALTMVGRSLADTTMYTQTGR